MKRRILRNIARERLNNQLVERRRVYEFPNKRGPWRSETWRESCARALKEAKYAAR